VGVIDGEEKFWATVYPLVECASVMLLSIVTPLTKFDSLEFLLILPHGR
jgi:hypothetical protein